jgi:hypothetical protein
MDELALRQEVTTIEERANGITVSDEVSFKLAAEFLRNIKTATSKVLDFFKPIKEGAYDSWKAICNKENEYKKPLEAAEKIVKGKANIYQMEQDRIRREQEVILMRQRQEEAERIAKEAEKLAEQGKSKEAERVFEQAVKAESAKVFVPETPKAQGMSFKTDYIVTVIDEKAVPAYINGMCIRQIDTAAIKKLAITFKGQIEIPGIKVEETRSAIVRGY